MLPGRQEEGRNVEGRKVEVSLTLRRIILLGTPLVLSVLMLFHPSPYDDILGELVPIAQWWIVLHTIQFVLFALMGAALDAHRGLARRRCHPQPAGSGRLCGVL